VLPSHRAFLLPSQCSHWHEPPVRLSHMGTPVTMGVTPDSSCIKLGFTSVDLTCNKCDNSSSSFCWQLGPTHKSSAPLQATAEIARKRDRTCTIGKVIREVRDSVKLELKSLRIQDELFWVPEGSLACFVGAATWPYNWSAGLIFGATGTAERALVLDGFWGHVWPKFNRKPIRQFPARLPSSTQLFK
jgi:hypothetical protein